MSIVHLFSVACVLSELKRLKKGCGTKNKRFLKNVIYFLFRRYYFTCRAEQNCISFDINVTLSYATKKAPLQSRDLVQKRSCTIF